MPSFASTIGATMVAAAAVLTVTDAAACGESRNVVVKHKPGYRLGAVVDFSNDEVLDGSFWTEQKIAENMESINVDSVKTTISSVSSLTEKFDVLGIDGALSITLMSAGISGKGSAKFLTQSDTTALDAEVIYTTQRFTKTDFVKEELMSELMAFNRFFTVKEATHVVTRVTYGGDVSISFKEKSDSLEGRDTLAASLEVKIDKLGLTGSATLELDDEQKNEFKDMSLEVISDVPLTKTPLTLEDVSEALKDIPNAFLSVNEGRGIPIEVTLTPICVWSSDAIGQKVRQITEDAITEITSVMEAIFSGVASAKSVAFSAGQAGMPVLKVQAEDFANTLDRFASSVRVRLAQLLPAIRSSLTSQIEAITFTSNMRLSPFNYLALRRWMETANEDILEQTRLRVNLRTEAIFPESNKKSGWINRKVVMVNSFPQLQRLLVDPDIETAMVLLTVNRNSGLSSHLDVMLDYMAHPPLTDKEVLEFPSSFDKAKWLEAPDNAARTRGMTVNMARWAAQTECVLSGCKNVKTGEVLAMMDYNSFIEEFLSMGIKLDRTTVLLYRNGKLVNTDFQLCASPDDPRDDDGRCLWRGEGDIPNGFSCALERPQGGCEGICGLDGRCRNFECSAIMEDPLQAMEDAAKAKKAAELNPNLDADPKANPKAAHDWHKIRLHPDAVSDPTGEADGLYQLDPFNEKGKCLAYTPDTSRGVQIEDCAVQVVTQRWKWGSDLKKAHILSEREPTLCMEAVLIVFREDTEFELGNSTSGVDATKSPVAQDDPTESPTTSFPTLNPTLSPTVVPSSGSEFKDYQRIAREKVYGHIEMRQCSNFNPMQFFQRYTVDFDTPHLMLRPPVVRPFDYEDLCAKFYRDPDSKQTGVHLVVCAPDLLTQAVYETAPWRFFTPYVHKKWLTSDDEAEFKNDATGGPIVNTYNFGNGEVPPLAKPLYAYALGGSELVFTPEEAYDDSDLYHFFWEGNYMRPWFTKSTAINGKTTNFYFSVAKDVVGIIQDSSDESPSPFFKVGSQFHSFREGETIAIEVRFWDYGDGKIITNDYIRTKLGGLSPEEDPLTHLVNRNILQCPSLCEPLTCADQGKKNAECYTAASEAICSCRAGWGGDDCETQVDACEDNKCADDEFCTDLLPPAGNTANDRKCQLVTRCKVNEYLARPSSEVSDSACSPCPEGQLQPIPNIKKVGTSHCKTVKAVAVEILTKLKVPLPVLPDDIEPELAQLQTEAALKEACESQNSHFFPSEGDTVPPRCSEPPCDPEKIPQCSEFGCSCVFRVQPAPVVTSTEFGLILGGSAALGLVGAVAVVIVVDAVLKKVGRA